LRATAEVKINQTMGSLGRDLEPAVDVSSLAAALVGAQAGRMQLAVATKMLKMSNDSQAAALQLLQAGQDNAGQLAGAGLGASLGSGRGQNLDITV
jgi:hypothetical protein